MKYLIVGKGTVGQALSQKLTHHKVLDSQTIEKFINENGEQFDVLIYAGVPGVKWRANAYPNEDEKIIDIALSNITKLSKFVKKIILISTIDATMDELNLKHGVYGRNRLVLEQKVMSKFKDALILRLPALFGSTVKKNIWYDLSNENTPARLNTSAVNAINDELRLMGYDESVKVEIKNDMAYYYPNVDFWEENVLGLNLMMNSHSKMLWFDLDKLSNVIDLLKQNNFKDAGLKHIFSIKDNAPLVMSRKDVEQFVLNKQSKEGLRDNKRVIDYSEILKFIAKEDIITIEEEN